MPSNLNYSQQKLNHFFINFPNDTLQFLKARIMICKNLLHIKKDNTF